MPKTTEEARQGILDALNSGDTIAALMPTPEANAFRLSVREALRGSRKQRLGKTYNLGGGAVRTPGSSSVSRVPEDSTADQGTSVGSSQSQADIDAFLARDGFNQTGNPKEIPPPGENETFKQYWERHFDGYNASEIDKLFGQKDVGSLAALEALEKLPWIGRAIGWASGLPLIGGWIGKKGGEWIFNKFFNQKVWMTPVDPDNPYASDSDVSQALTTAFGNPDRFLPSSNNPVDPSTDFGSYTNFGNNPITNDADAASSSYVTDPAAPLLGQSGGMPGAVPSTTYGSRAGLSYDPGNSITGNGAFNYATRIRRAGSPAPVSNGGSGSILKSLLSFLQQDN